MTVHPNGEQGYTYSIGTWIGDAGWLVQYAGRKDVQRLEGRYAVVHGRQEEISGSLGR